LDKAHKLIRTWDATDAAVHDRQKLDDVLDLSNTGKEVWADSVYRSAQTEARLTAKGLQSRIHRRAARNPSAFTAPEVGQHDALESARPCRACLRPAAELDRRQDRAQRCIARASFKIGMMNLGYNIPRLVQLEHGCGRNDSGRPSTPKRFRCIPVQHNRNDLLKGPRRHVAGPSEFEYQVEAVARPILRNALRARSQRIRDGTYVLVLPTDQHDAFDR
jgi:hypothetical protein